MNNTTTVINIKSQFDAWLSEKQREEPAGLLAQAEDKAGEQIQKDEVTMGGM